MANAARMNFEMPVLLINLKRQPDRRKQSLKLLRELGFSNIQVVDAIDGMSLLQECSGRARKQTKTQWRLTYNVDGTRQTFPLKTSGLGNAGGCDLWGQHACALSHRRCVEKIQRFFKGNRHEAALVVEDDLCLPPLLSVQEFQQNLRRFWQQLSKHFPEWTGFWLGGTGVFSIGATNGPTHIPNVHFADWVMQAHAYAVRRSATTTDLLNAFVEKVDSGYMADNAWASVMRAHKGTFFFAMPNLLLQDSKMTSSLQYVSVSGGQKGYVESRNLFKKQSQRIVAMKARANMPPKLKNALGPDRRGRKRIRKQNLKQMRQSVGQKGGFKKAGGTSTAKEVRKKELAMQRHFEKHGVFPTKSLSAKKWKASTSLWSRVRKACLGEG